MIIPLSTDLRLGRQPWVTWIVIALCITVFGFEFESNLKYDISVHGYCQLIASNKQKNPDDLLSQNVNGCSYLLHSYHIQSLRGEDPGKIETDILDILDRLPTGKGARVDAKGRPALAIDCTAPTLFWAKPLSDPFGGTAQAAGRHPVKMSEPEPAADAPFVVGLPTRLVAKIAGYF